MSAEQQALLMIGQGAFAPPVQNCIGDPYYTCGPAGDSQVVMLLRGEGTNGSTTIIDSGFYTRTDIYFNGVNTISTAQSKFGSASILCSSSTSSNAVVIPQYSQYYWGTKDFTVEFWTYSNAALIQCMFSTGSSASASGFSIRRGFDGSRLVFRTGSTDRITSNAGTFALATWHHIALTRQSQVYYLWLNGSLVGSYAYAGSLDTSNLYLGTEASGGGFSFGNTYSGYLDEVRITLGTARYTGSSYAVPTAAFPDPITTPGWNPAAPRTIFSWHAEDLLDDSCFQPKTLSLSGTAALSTTQVKYNASSLYIQNTGFNSVSGAVLLDHLDFDFGNSDFTIECWAYRTANTYLGTFYRFTAQTACSLAVSTTGNITINSGVSGVAAVTTTDVSFPLNQWVYVVLQRRSGSLEIYINGIFVGSRIVGTSAINCSSDFYIGRVINSTIEIWNGYLDDFRITKGAARYGGTYPQPSDILPTAQYPDSAPADPNFADVDLLIHGNSFVDSSSYNRTLTQVTGTVGISALSKFGTGSFYNTVSGFFRYDFSVSAKTSSKFTFECWHYFPSSNTRTYCGFLGYTNGSFYWGIYIDPATRKIFVSNSDIVILQSLAAAPIDVWYHIAVATDGLCTRLFINGVLQASSNSIVFSPAQTAYSIGLATFSGNTDLIGYVYDYRFTRGFCRYLASFTPPALTFCESISDGFSGQVSGLDTLIPQELTTTAGTLTVANPYVVLSGTALTAAQGSVATTTPDRVAALGGAAVVVSQNPVSVFTTSRTAALSGVVLSSQVGALSAQPYPDFTNQTLTGITTEAYRGYIEFFFKPDGTIEIVDQDGIYLGTPTWISQTMNISNIAQHYQVLSVTKLVGSLQTWHPLVPYNLQNGFTITVSNPSQLRAVAFKFLVSIGPTTTNPRYGESGYYGQYSFAGSVLEPI